MISRRTFIKGAVVGTAGVASGLLPLGMSAPTKTARAAVGPEPDLSLSLAAMPDQARIFSGPPTDVWRYKSQVLSGDPAQLIQAEGGYLGPTIRVEQGQRLLVRHYNGLPQETIIHWHGLSLPAEMDGHPRYAVPPGGTYAYEFQVNDRPGTYWYHPHPDRLTGPQVYGGLAGLFIVTNPQEQALGLPDGEYDVPLVIQDRTFDRDNQLVYIGRNPMSRMVGFLGRQVLVNGRPDYKLDVAATAYRLRILNGSNSRIYDLTWDDGRDLIIIGTDGGLLEKPIRRRHVLLAPAQRLELWADFSKDREGSGPSLVSREFDAGFSFGPGRMGPGMMRGGGMMGPGRFADPGGAPNGAPMTIMSVQVTRPGSGGHSLPERLLPIERHSEQQAWNFGNPRQFFLEMNRMAWTINGRLFDMTGVAPDEVIEPGALEVWEFLNQGFGPGMMGMMSLPHPMHIHGGQFQVLSREGGWMDGFVDEGLHDTVLVMPGQRVRILMKFASNQGLFIYHCHNLEHEDMGMMRNYLVERK